MNARLLAVSLLGLAACSRPDTRFPSLLPRAIEWRDDAIAVRPAPVAAADPALDAQVARLRSAAERAGDAFDRSLAGADRRIRAGAGMAEGSERWLEAQVALAELDVARTGIDEPLATLEQLALDRGVAGLPPYPALDAALAAVQARAAGQRGRIAELAGTLR